jgi:hypothetical protein
MHLILVEIIVVCFWLLFAGVFYTFSLSSLSKIFLDYSSNKYMLNNKCLIISEIFQKAKLPRKIEVDTLKYLKNTFSLNAEKISEKALKNLLSEIPNSLKYKISNDIYQGAIKDISIFSNCSKSFISTIIPLLQPLNVPPKVFVYECDEVPQKIYFILEGSVKFLTEDKISLSVLNKGSYFGEIEILRKTYRENSALAINKCFFLTLNKNIIWEEIIRNFAEFFELLLENMIKRHNFNEKMKDLVSNISLFVR